MPQVHLAKLTDAEVRQYLALKKRLDQVPGDRDFKQWATMPTPDRRFFGLLVALMSVGMIAFTGVLITGAVTEEVLYFWLCGICALASLGPLLLIRPWLRLVNQDRRLERQLANRAIADFLTEIKYEERPWPETPRDDRHSRRRRREQ